MLQILYIFLFHFYDINFYGLAKMKCVITLACSYLINLLFALFKSTYKVSTEVDLHTLFSLWTKIQKLLYGWVIGV